MFFFLVSKFCNAQMVMSGEVTANLPVHSGISYLEDKKGTLGFTDIFKLKEKFEPVNKDVPNFGISSSAYWLKIKIQKDRKSVV